MRVAGEQIRQHVAQRSTFKRRSADSLKDNTKAAVIRSAGGRIIKLRASWSKKHASFIEYGTRAHIIRPRRAKALRFRAKGGGVVFARRVQHPGTRPYKFGWKAMTAGYRVLGDKLLGAMARVSRRF